MPFIWDDNKYQLVDDEDEYDKNRFVISRKLFISLKDDETAQKQSFTVEYLNRSLRKYGAIESIEIISCGKCEAYVTFANDLNAYLAVAHNELEKQFSSRKLCITPADTWVQPQMMLAVDVSGSNQMDDDDESDENVPAFLKLNEDCILELFKYLDFDSLVNMSQVCKQFHQLLHQHCFSRYRDYSIENGSSSIPMPLAKVRRSLICIGPYITELKFKWHDFDCYKRSQRFLEKIGQYVGKNIRCLRFNNVLIRDQQIPAIKSILMQLESLEIIVYNPDYDLDLDFKELCPNLRKLKLLENMQLLRCCKPWPQLRHLSIVGNEYMVLNTFRLFIEQNPQLTCLKFTAYHADERLQAVAQYLPNVEKLTILPSFPNLSALNIVYLSSLQHLTTLNLMYLDENDFNGILQCLTRFTGLRVLKLHLLFDSNDDDGHFEPNQQHIISLAQDLPHLQQLCTRYVKWKESTVIDFLRFASQLQILHIHWCDLPITNSMVWKIVKTLQTHRSQQQTKPLQLFVNPSEVITLQMINDQDLKRYLNVSTKCRHFETN